MPGPQSREDRLRVHGRFGVDNGILSQLVDYLITLRAKMKFVSATPAGPVAVGDEVVFVVQLFDAADAGVPFLDRLESLEVTFALDAGSVAGTIITAQPVEFVSTKTSTGLVAEAICVAKPTAGAGSLILKLTDSGGTGFDVTDTKAVVVS